MHKHFISWQFVVFVAGGVLSAVADIGTMQLLLSGGAAALAAASAGFVVGLAVNYAFHAKVTFRQLGCGRALGRYLCVVGLNYLLTLALVALGQQLAGSALLGKIASLPVVAANGFLLSKFWVFKR
jgi:putative flippase GtrA